MSSCMHSDPKARLSAAACVETYVSLKSGIERELHFQKLSVQALKEQLQGKQPVKPTLKRHHSVL